MNVLSVFRPSAWRRLATDLKNQGLKRARPWIARQVFEGVYFDGLMTKHNVSAAVGLNPGRNSYRHYFAEQVARCARNADGVFVSVGVASGNVALRILENVKPDKDYWLIDSWDGRRSAADPAPKYSDDFANVQDRFARFPNVKFLRGVVPESLSRFTPDKIAFAHFNLGDPDSEIVALDILAPRLQKGGSILIDAYGRGVSTDAHRRGYEAVAARCGLTDFKGENGQMELRR